MEKIKSTQSTRQDGDSNNNSTIKPRNKSFPKGKITEGVDHDLAIIDEIASEPEKTALERKWEDEDMVEEKQGILEELNGEWVPIPNHSENCSLCYGRGYQGKAKVNLKSGGYSYTYVPCSRCGKDSRQFMNVFTGKLRKF